MSAHALHSYALHAGVATNLDNFQELERAAAIMAADPALQQGQEQPSRLIGLRINPQVRVCAARHHAPPIFVWMALLLT